MVLWKKIIEDSKKMFSHEVGVCNTSFADKREE